MIIIGENIKESLQKTPQGERAPHVGAPQNKGYSEAGASRRKKSLKGFTARSGSPREDIDWNNYTLRQRGRMLVMSTPIAKSAITTNRTNVIGMGLQLKSKIDHEALGMTPEKAAIWQRKTEKEFALWAENKRACDATGVNDFYSMQQLAFSSWLTSGDAFVIIKQYEPTNLMPYSLRLHIVEADRIRTPGKAGQLLTDGKADNGNKIFDGVEVNSDGAIVAYYVHNTYPNEINGEKQEYVRVEAYGELTGLPNILQLMDSERPEQYRGVTYLAPVIEPLLQLRRYTDSELTAANIESCFAAFIKTNAGTAEMPFNEVGWGDVAGVPDSTPEVSRDPNEYELGAGTVNILEPGEDVVFADPKRPSGGFDNFVNAVATQVGAALEIPKDLLMKAFNASYSASRAALLEAWKAFQMRRKWFTSDFCRPIYEIWLAEAVARGRILAPGFFSNAAIRKAYLGSEWIGPSQGMLDPTKEIEAEVLAIQHGFSTHEQSTIKLNGGQWQDNVAQLAIENDQLAEALPDNQQDQDPVNLLVGAIVAEITKRVKEELNNGQS
ncbi:MAG: phage portal protein [Paludibacteraceae bacterium]|nr:phage portal protein [Paludibacteraceae bacterium]